MSVDKVKIFKPKFDEREYKYIRLKNGLVVLLISDPTTDMSAAAMDVDVGAIQDPEDVNGLAHFTEHMLFMGSKKYPDESEYMKFINEHSGQTNAWTSETDTNFYFGVGNNFIRDSLDRFA